MQFIHMLRGVRYSYIDARRVHVINRVMVKVFLSRLKSLNPELEIISMFRASTIIAQVLLPSHSRMQEVACDILYATEFGAAASSKS
jgi:hypothetical protein